MAGNKTIPVQRSSDSSSGPNGHAEAQLRRQLQEEIDKLALLIEEVKRQSDRVQVTADAIADKILLGYQQETSAKARRNGGRNLSKSPEVSSVPQ